MIPKLAIEVTFHCSKISHSYQLGPRSGCRWFPNNQNAGAPHPLKEPLDVFQWVGTGCGEPGVALPLDRGHIIAVTRCRVDVGGWRGCHQLNHQETGLWSLVRYYTWDIDLDFN